jgi:hypothetical protein
MSLQDGIQVVLQYPLNDTKGRCRGFVGLSATNPAYFCVIPAHQGGRLRRIAQTLGEDIANTLMLSSPAAQNSQVPCRGIHTLGECHAHDVSDCIKVLVVAIDNDPNSRNFIIPEYWRQNDPKYRIVPVFVNRISSPKFPPSLRHLNSVFWDPKERISTWRILSVGGIVSSRPRLFISYVRRDSEGIAQQLFDNLHREGFDIFLDRFSIEPGVDFQVRLTEELSNMGTVLLIESKNILKSKWVRHEVNFARSHRLGLFSLKLPGGKSVPGVRKEDRIIIPTSGITPKRRVLKKNILREILPSILQNHNLSEYRRITYLRDTMTDALLLEGINEQRIEPDNTLVVKTPRGELYAFRLSNLPPELQDFHSVSSFRYRCKKAYVIAPTKYMDWRRQTRLEWLAQESNISLEDESEIVKLSRRL